MTTQSIRLTPIAAAVLALSTALFTSNGALAQTPKALDEIKVIGDAERGYAVKTSTTATKTDTLLRDTPQAITVISKELIEDQGMQGIADAIRYVPGIVTAQGEGNRDTAVFRGNSSTSDFYVDGIRDDVQYFRDFYNIESVEALKGSNAMIFGRGGSGGVINRVSKQPTWTASNQATLSIGSWANRRATVDVGAAINEHVAFRVNALAADANSYRAGVTNERAGINPTLAIRAGKNTNIVLGYEHFRDDRVADRGITSFNGRPFDTDESTFMGSAAHSPVTVRVNAFNALVEHDFGNGMSLRNRTRVADYDKFYQNVFANSAVSATTGRLNLAAYNNATERTNLFNQTDFSYAFQSGAIKHKLVTGIELGRQETDNLRLTGQFNGAPTQSVSAANPVMSGNLAFVALQGDANNHGVATTASVYVQDQIEFSPQWQVVAGVRYDRFNVDFRNNRDGKTVEVTDTPFSPRIGVVYKPVTAVSLYGSYSIAYVPRAGEQLSSLTATNQAFDPEKFKNLEIGAKWDLSPTLAATAAIYKLDRTNVVVPNPANSAQSILVDGQTSKGVELGLQGKVTAAWSIMGGYAYQDAKLTAAQSATVKNGAVLAMVPENTFSLWNRYDLSPQWGGALGVVYRDSIYANVDNLVTVPSYTRLDGAVYYTINKDYKLQLNIENLLDKKYYASAHSNFNITPGSPRAFRLALNAKF